MDKKIFNESFYEIDGELLKLSLIETVDGDNKVLPFYYWNIIEKETNSVIGAISLRIGKNYHSYFNGNIGYEINEEHRGHHFAFLACKMLIPVAKYYNMNEINISCNYDNIASIKTIERLGGKLLEEVVPPKNYIFYYEGMPKQRIYTIMVA